MLECEQGYTSYSQVVTNIQAQEPPPIVEKWEPIGTSPSSH